jgi:hypothetical protein
VSLGFWLITSCVSTPYALRFVTVGTADVFIEEGTKGAGETRLGTLRAGPDGIR